MSIMAFVKKKKDEALATRIMSGLSASPGKLFTERSEMIIFELILTTFKLSIVFIGRWSSSVNWLEPKIQHNQRAFHGFGQAKFPDGGLVSGSSQFSTLPQPPQKNTA